MPTRKKRAAVNVKYLLLMAVAALALAACDGAAEGPAGGSPTSTPKAAIKSGGAVPGDASDAPTPPSVPTPITFPDGGLPWPSNVGDLLRQEMLRGRVGDDLRAGGGPLLLPEVEYLRLRTLRS